MKMASSPAPTERRTLCVLSDIDGTLSVPTVRVLIAELGKYHKVIFVTARTWKREAETREQLRLAFPDLTYLLMMKSAHPRADEPGEMRAPMTPLEFKVKTICYLKSCGYEPVIYFENDPEVIAWAQNLKIPVIPCR